VIDNQSAEVLVQGWLRRHGLYPVDDPIIARPTAEDGCVAVMAAAA